MIRVRVHNKMEGSQGTAIHWHGVLQHGSPYMDGVSMVTQWSIPAYAGFTKALDTMNRPGLYKELEYTECPLLLFRVTKLFHENMKIII